MKIIFSGSRDWYPRLGINSLFIKLQMKYGEFTVIQGKATGIDECARDCAIAYGLPYLDYPANWNKYGKRAGMVRNQEMLYTNPDLVIAFPRDESSRGTMGMIGLTKKAGIDLWIYPEWLVLQYYRAANIAYDGVKKDA